MAGRLGAILPIIGDVPAADDATFDLMMSFLRQNSGHFSKRAREHEFKQLTDNESHAIEAIYQDLLMDEAQPAEHREA